MIWPFRQRSELIPETPPEVHYLGEVLTAESLAGFTAADRCNMTGSRHKDGKFPFTTSRGRFGLGDWHNMRAKI